MKTQVDNVLEEKELPQAKSLKLNFAMNLLLTLSSILFPLISYPYAARVLGPGSMGAVAFASSVVSYFTLISQLGIPTYGVRECAKVRDDRDALSKTVQELLGINLVCTVVSYALFMLVVHFTPQLSGEKELCVVLSSTIALGTIGMEWLFKGLEEYVYISIRSLIFKAIAIVMLFILVQSESDYIFYGGVTIFAASASNICNLIRSHRFVYFKPKEKLELRKHLRAVFVMFALTAVTTVYTSLNSTMLGLLSSTSEVGYYDLAVKVRMILVSVVTSLGVVLLPRSSYYLAHGEYDRFLVLSGKALNFVARVALPFVLYVLLFAPQIVAFLGGDAFGASIAPLRVISLAVLLVGFSNITGTQMLIPLGKERSMLVAAIAGALAALVADVALMQRFASLGASISTVIAESVVLGAQVMALWGAIDRSRIVIKLAKPLFGCSIACLASFWVSSLECGLIFQLGISAVLFFAAYLIVLLLTRDELVGEVALSVVKRLKGTLEHAED